MSADDLIEKCYVIQGVGKRKRKEEKKKKNKVLGDKCIVVMYDQPKQQQLQLRIPSVSSFSLSLSI